MTANEISTNVHMKWKETSKVNYFEHNLSFVVLWHKPKNIISENKTKAIQMHGIKNIECDSFNFSRLFLQINRFWNNLGQGQIGTSGLGSQSTAITT